MTAGAQFLSNEEMRLVQSAPQGGVVKLAELWKSQATLLAPQLNIVPVRGPQFLLSDKPEYFYTGNGVSMDEHVQPGQVRLYIYHVPFPGDKPKIISAVIDNLGSNLMDLHFVRQAFPKPGTDYHLIGKTGLIQYFDSKPSKTTNHIAVGGRMIIDTAMDSTLVFRDQLVHGFYEFEITQPGRIRVFERDPDRDSLSEVDKLPSLPLELAGFTANGAGRGSYPTNNFLVTNTGGVSIETTNGPMRIILADGRRDKSVTGRDGISGTVVKNHGDYGVMYHIKLDWKSSDGRGIVLLMARTYEGGKWCETLSAAMHVNSAYWKENTVAIPTGRVDFGKDGEMVVIQKYPPPTSREGVIEFDYSPPGASCLPTPMILLPY